MGLGTWHMQSADGQLGGLPPQLIWHQVSDMAGLTALHEVGSPSAGNLVRVRVRVRVSSARKVGVW